ncbi:hypothetical protein [Brucella phage EF4]|uniref:Uncharacterized protein n=1 Tax=Brucella phage EF4 TaxID=2706778 RepID=A0A6C0X1J1_9CAUD|nr:hypothetical protein [Brucella phage EF4]
MGKYEWKPFTLLVSAEEVEKEVLKIEAGKYYKTGDGRKVGPIKSYEDRYFHKASFACREWTYLENGKWAGSLNNDNRDLISEWSEAPIRTVTRREIVEGVYGSVDIYHVTKKICMRENKLQYEW